MNIQHCLVHEDTPTSHLLSLPVQLLITVQAGAKAWGNIFITLSTNWTSLKGSSLPEHWCWHVRSQKCSPTVDHLLMATSSRITHHVTKLISSQTCLQNVTMTSLYSSALQSADLICIEHLGDVEDRRFTSSADRSTAIVWCYHVNRNQKLSGMLPTLC